MNANKPYEFHMSDLFTLQHTDRLDGGGTFESLLYTMAEEMGFVTRFRGDFALDVARLQEEGSKAAFTGSWIWITRRNGTHLFTVPKESSEIKLFEDYVNEILNAFEAKKIRVFLITKEAGTEGKEDEDHVWQLSRYEIPGIPTGYLYDDLLETTAQIDAMNQALSGTKYIVENTKGMEISPEERFPVETRSMEIALQEMVKTANEVLAALSKSHWEQNRKDAK